MTHTEKAELQRRIKSKIKVDKKTGCHNWEYSLNRKNGYPRMQVNKKLILVHRLSYTLWVGEVPEHTVIHHTCGNRVCVNPKHLQATSNLQNQAEMRERQAYQRRIKELGARLERVMSSCVCQGADRTL